MSGYQEMYNSSASRSPGSHRHPPQQLRRQPSRQFDAYGPMSSTLYEEPPLGRYDTNPLDRLNATMPSGSYPYDISGSQTWNANSVGLGGLGVNSATATSRMRNVRSRTALPTTWLDQQNSLPNSFSLAPGQHQPSPQIRAENPHDAEDELIPTAIVIKNIPFAVKKEQLIQLMTEMNLPLPYAFNYHFDNGVFRGLAFANFTSAEETATVIELLNHFELQGRKLRVEYKKMLPAQERERIEREKRERRGQLEEQHRPMATSQLQHQTSMSSLASHLPTTSPSPVSQRAGKLEVDMNDAQTLQYYSQLLLFKQDLSKEALIFGTNLTPAQRRIVHTISHNMGLAHTSRGTGDQRQVHVYRAGPGANVSPPVPAMPATVTSDAARRGLSRAATIDFGESRHEQQAYGSSMRQSSFLNVLDSPGPGGYANAQNLRAAKSFADLRSFTPSPVPSSASFPAALQTNGARFQQQQQQQQGYDAGTSGASNTPTLTPTPSGSSLGIQRVDDSLLVNSLGGLSLGTSVTGPSGSPRRTRGIWDASDLPTTTAGSNNGSGSSAGAIGSNRSIGLGFDSGNQNQERVPVRQPRGPAPERGPGFRRQNSHQQRGSDELRSNPGVEIIVE
ncbi:RNA-binding post-transcriptional regulator [Trichophyton mentagrophytes]|nr:RNA-binding post-transcriptional regulator [Trichophyton mentagrophytes]